VFTDVQARELGSMLGTDGAVERDRGSTFFDVRQLHDS
jgi:hypothetical protein